MEVRIAVANAPRELTLELADDVDRDALADQVRAVMSGEAPMLWITDRKGHRVGVAGTNLAWVDLGPSAGQRRVGFSAS
ncbi:MAG: DUF3107 domain-containing protein [Acidimicrobiales bacterium]